MNEHMLEVSAAIITDRSRILCFQKGISKRSYLTYKFEFPGGKLEAGESPKEALIRELKEELNFNASNLRMKPFKDLTHDYADFSVLIHYILIFNENPNYTLKEHIAAVWKPITQLEELNWADADFEAVKLLEAEGIE